MYSGAITPFKEILRSNQANTVLELKKLGVQDLIHFDLTNPPAPGTILTFICSMLVSLRSSQQAECLFSILSSWPGTPAPRTKRQRYLVAHRAPKQVLRNWTAFLVPFSATHDQRTIIMCMRRTASSPSDTHPVAI
ncbi:hypothetical protein GGR57DRAFT_503255 [Xylariaceae sp. FL1272]|nr:hypothetical protein GGR57DRAFT_503255 [Xylariaceae sp. FL1272]